MTCECCGKIVESRDSFALHTACMRNHHLHLMGERSSRCKSVAKRTTVEYQRLPADFEGDYVALHDGNSYFTEAKRLRFELGISRAGTFGAICEKCHKEMPAREGPSDPSCNLCECGTIADAATTMRALGLDMWKPRYASRVTAV